MAYIGFKALRESRGLRFLNINVRSWYKKHKKHGHLLKELDFVCITESWLNDTHMDSNLYMPGYCFIRQDRPVELGKTGGGIINYVRKEFAPHLTVIQDMCILSKDLECTAFTITIPNRRHMIIVTAYRPPRGKPKECFKKLKEILGNEAVGRKEIYLLTQTRFVTKSAITVHPSVPGALAGVPAMGVPPSWESWAC